LKAGFIAKTECGGVIGAGVLNSNSK